MRKKESNLTLKDSILTRYCKIKHQRTIHENSTLTSKFVSCEYVLAISKILYVYTVLEKIGKYRSLKPYFSLLEKKISNK